MVAAGPDPAATAVLSYAVSAGKVMHQTLRPHLIAAVVLGLAVLVLPGSGAAAPAPDARTAACSATPAKVVPRKAEIPRLRHTYKVVKVKRSHGAIGTPPTTTKGKKLVGWDPHNRPGSGVGSVVIDAHTWPDGSALGNAMLKKLRRGDVVTLTDGRGHGVCYRIASRHSYPRDRVPLAKMFRTWGSEQLVIVVCSGKRLGPGNWLRRTVWFGLPTARV
jgi:hypothetical protein